MTTFLQEHERLEREMWALSKHAGEAEGEHPPGAFPRALEGRLPEEAREALASGVPGSSRGAERALAARSGVLDAARRVQEAADGEDPGERREAELARRVANAVAQGQGGCRGYRACAQALSLRPFLG